MKLFIDSSTNYLFLSLIKNDQEFTFVRSGKNDHSETLVDYLAKFLTDQKVKPTEIKELYIGRGPGSYTGLRISGTVGKVFAYAIKAKLYSFSSLDLVLAKHLNQDGKYLSLIDAKKNHSYYKAVTVINGIINIDLDEDFKCNDDIDQNHEYLQLYPTEAYLNEAKDIATNILKYHLYKEEDEMNYTPNYLRNGI